MPLKDPINLLLLLLMGCILLLCPIEGRSSLWILEDSTLDGYTDVTNYEDGFIAVGSNGQIDRISKTGEINHFDRILGLKFNSVLTHNKQIIAAGDNGHMVISVGSEKLEKIDSGTDSNINSLTGFRNRIVAGADKGEILIGNGLDEFKSIQLNLKGNVVSVSANEVFCYGVTDSGEIIHSTDGENWNIFDFNQEYKGFYKSCYFTSVLVTDHSIAVTGVNELGVPVFLLSSKGKVWSERALVYKNEQGMNEYLEGSPNDIFYNKLHDQFYLVCDHGKLMVLPSCSQCNKLVEVATLNISGISGLDDVLMVVGDRFYRKPINPEEIDEFTPNR